MTLALQPQTNPVAGSNYTLFATILDANTSPRQPLQGLSGATVTLKVMRPDKTTATLSATVLSVPLAQAQVNFAPTDLPIGGDYQYTFDVTFSDGTKGATDPPQTLTVTAALF